MQRPTNRPGRHVILLGRAPRHVFAMDGGWHGFSVCVWRGGGRIEGSERNTHGWSGSGCLLPCFHHGVSIPAHSFAVHGREARGNPPSFAVPPPGPSPDPGEETPPSPRTRTLGFRVPGGLHLRFDPRLGSILVASDRALLPSFLPSFLRRRNASKRGLEGRHGRPGHPLPHGDEKEQHLPGLRAVRRVPRRKGTSNRPKEGGGVGRVAERLTRKDVRACVKVLSGTVDVLWEKNNRGKLYKHLEGGVIGGPKEEDE